MLRSRAAALRVVLDVAYKTTDPVLDAVAYGGNIEWAEKFPTEPDPGPGASLGRCPDGEDTQDNKADFGIGVPTPGASNDCG